MTGKGRIGENTEEINMAAVKLDFLINGVTGGCVVRRNTL